MGLFEQRFHQLAMYVDDPEFSVQQMQRLGYTEWIHDQATLTGEVYGNPMESLGMMWFNYEFYGAEEKRDFVPHDLGHTLKVTRASEMEFLKYEGHSWHEEAGRTENGGDVKYEPFISHMSVYVDDAEAEVKRLGEDFGLDVIQWFHTGNHINKYLKEKKQTFYEFIFDTRLLFGYDLKIIQKIQH